MVVGNPQRGSVDTPSYRDNHNRSQIMREGVSLSKPETLPARSYGPPTPALWFIDGSRNPIFPGPQALASWSERLRKRRCRSSRSV
jgi:hypothetical protein